MKILVLASPWLGGSGTVGIELAKELALEHQVYFLSFDFPFRQGDKESNLVLYNFTSFSYALFPYPLYTESLTERLIEIVEKHDIDIIHAHYSLVFGTSAVIAKNFLNNKKKKVKVVVTFHGTDAIGFDSEKPGKSSFVNLNKFIIQEADCITAGSNYLKNFVESHYVKKKKFDVIPNFVDLNVFKKKNDFKKRDSIVHVSNFRKVKRAIEVAKAFRLIQKKDKKVKLVFIGEGPEKKNIIKYVDKEKLENVEFLDRQKEHSVSDFLNRAIALFQPSYFENAPLVLLEAAACGTPQIATDVGGISEILLDGETGFLVKNDSDLPVEFANKFFLLKEKNLWNSFSNNCVDLSLSFSVKNIVKKYELLYSSLNGRFLKLK